MPSPFIGTEGSTLALSVGIASCGTTAMPRPVLTISSRVDTCRTSTIEESGFSPGIVPVLFVIRRSLQETEEFKQRKHRPSLREILRSMLDNWSLVLAGMLLVAMTTVSFYLITVYTPTFGKAVLKLSTSDALIVTLCVGLSNFIWLPIMGALSDRVSLIATLVLYRKRDARQAADVTPAASTA